MKKAKDERHRWYLYDLGHLLKEYAFQAKAEMESAKPGKDRSFHEGRLMAFYRVITLMQQQAEGFQIPLKDLRLDDLDADKDLL